MNHSPILIFLLFVIYLAGCTNPQSKKIEPERTHLLQPNIIIFLADDLGYADLACYGNKDIQTPNIDKLAKQGLRFTNFYSNGPECTPTRVALLTGRYQQRTGGLECAIGAGNVGRYDEAEWLSEQGELGLPPSENTLLHAVKNAGYETAILGKWHLGYDKKFRPAEHGFDYSFGPIGYGGDYFYHTEQVNHGLTDFTGMHTLAENGKEVFHTGEYTTEIISEKAIDWLKSRKSEKPFFLYLPYTAPHSPYQGPKDKKDRPLTADEWNIGSHQTYIEMIESLDNGIGYVLTYLDENQLNEETLAIFFSDNGGTKKANNGPFSGTKGQVYEGGIHVPCIIRWPGKIEANLISEQTCISFDLTSSIVNLLNKNHNQKLDGYDILSHILEQKEDFDRTLFWRKKRGDMLHKAVRDGDIKYFTRINGDSVLYEKVVNLKNDPEEKNNLLEANPQKAKELKLKLNKWEKKVESQRLKEFYTN